MTYRERRLAKAERLRGWAEKRQSAASAQLNSQPELRHDWAFITQPGRIPERERMNRRDDAAFRSMEKAASMSSRADSIERAAEHAIYRDDPDAADQLRAKLAGLEAERDRWTAYNKACRKAGNNAAALALLDDDQRREVAELDRIHYLRPAGAVPPYLTANLGGNITRTRQRLAWIERGAERYLVTRRADACSRCGEPVPVGSTVAYSTTERTIRHYPDCERSAAA